MSRCSQQLEEHPVFPPMVVQMMAVGEETGALDEMLDKIADFYDQEVEATVDALTSLIEPLLIVVMGVVRRRHGHLALPADVQHHQAHQVARAEHALQPVRPPANSNWREWHRIIRSCSRQFGVGRGSAGRVEEVPERAGEVDVLHGDVELVGEHDAVDLETRVLAARAATRPCVRCRRPCRCSADPPCDRSSSGRRLASR